MKTVESLIDEDLIATLATVRTSAGYFHNFWVDEPDPAGGNPEKDALCTVADGEPEPQDDKPINQDRYQKTYTVVVKVIEPEGSDVTLRERMGNAYADVVKALTETRTSFTRNGQALWTRVGQPKKEIDAGGNSADVSIPVTVLFATALGQPTVNPYTTA